MTKRLLFLSVLTLLLRASACAYDFRVDGIYYNVLDSTELSCEVTYLSTSNSNYSAYQGSVKIPNTVEYDNVTYAVRGISDSAFEGCTALTEITIPNSVTTIGSSAFYQCYGLTEITIPNSVTTIGNYTFQYCTGLTEITIPNSVTSIGNAAFYNCTGLTEVNFNAVACTSAGSSDYYRAFYGCTNISKVDFGDNVTIIPSCLCYELMGLTSVTIPNSVTSIGDWAFRYCTGLTQVTIGNSVTSIGDRAFSHCTELTEITIPNSVTTIGSYAFAYCYSLTQVTIGESVTKIGSYAFQNCSGLTEITIPNSVTEIGSYAFQNCPVLTIIYSLNPEPPTCGSSSFSSQSIKSTCVLYVPEGSLGAYANASGWKDFYNIVEIDVSPVADILAGGNEEAVGYYTTDGKKVSQPQRGINIIRYSDGTARKVLVK